MKSTTVSFSEWQPDQPDLATASTVVTNAIPDSNSYRCIGALSPVSANALDSVCLGAVWAQDDDGNYFYFAGNTTKLYRLSGVSFSDVSKVGGYSAASWEFAKWDQRLIAVNVSEPTQYFDMGSSSSFADLAGSPPKAKHIATVRDFIIMGNLDEGGTSYPSRLRWSGFNNSEQWVSSQATQSDFQDLLGRGGAIQRIVPGETGLILQEHSIRRMTYVGPPTIFRIDEVEKDRGCQAPNSVAWSGDLVFYYSHDGFFMKQGDNPSVPIGTEKVDRFFKDDLSGGDFDGIRGAVDRSNKIIAWCYPSSSSGTNRVIMYRWDIKKWSVIDQDAKIIIEYVSPAYTLEDLDGVLGNIDDNSINVDSTAYLGGSVHLGAFGSDHKLSTFSGSALPGTIETNELGDPAGRRISIKSVRPITDGAVTICVGTRNNQNENYNYGPPVSVNAKGEMSFRTSARYHRFKVSITGDFKQAQGVDVFYREEGTR